MPRSVSNSSSLLARAKRVIPRAAQTLSKAPDQFVEGVSPYAIQKGLGCHVWDVDQNDYLDLTCALGAIVLGYRHPVVEEAIQKQRERGCLFGLPGDLEVELAEKIHDLIPFAEMSRFGLNGSDVTTAAIRVARAYTGRDHVAKCGYHGWPDWTIATNSMRSKGVPQAVKDLTHEFTYNDLSSLEKILTDHPNQIAAVILEPMDLKTPAPGFLEGVKTLAHAHGAVLIFDEMITGFRVALGGAAAYFHVEPDLVCYGKAVSNGEPLSVLAGKREIMEALQSVFFSFTYAGFLPSVAAALATLDFMQKNPVQEKISTLGHQLIQGLQELVTRHQLPMSVQGYWAHPILSFKDPAGVENRELKTFFLQETAKAGILTNTKNFVSYSHESADIVHVLSVFDALFGRMSQALSTSSVASLLEGPVVTARYPSARS